MKKTQTKKPTVIEVLRGLPGNVQRAIAEVSGSDGHSIFTLESYRKAGMPEPLVQAFTEKHKSDGSPKGTIFAPGGGILPELTGIYGLRVIECLADSLGCSVGSYMGRGFRAQAAYRAVIEKLNARDAQLSKHRTCSNCGEQHGPPAGDTCPKYDAENNR